MGFLLAVLSLVVAEEVVQLEPVKATNVYGCNALVATDPADTPALCRSDPYCYYGSTHTKKCVDDPCLRYSADGECPPNQELGDGTGVSVTCEVVDLGFATAKHDCSGNPGTGKVCRSNDSTAPITYCEYTQLKDSSCPDSICMKFISGPAVNNDKHCVKKTAQASSADFPCLSLTQTDCKLVPKCRWDSSSGGSCIPDYCFQKKPTISACSGLEANDNWPGQNVSGLCVDWHPLSSDDGTPLDYCIHKDNADANICYFGIANITTGTKDYAYDWSPNWKSATDPGTYPTYNYGTTDPDCGTEALPKCEGHGDCQTIVNSKGAFAGKYCTDGKHSAANILRIPSLLVLLVVSAFVAMFTL